MRKLWCAAWVAACVAISGAQPIPTSNGKEFYGMIMQNSGGTAGQYFRVFLSSSVLAHASVVMTDGSFSQNVTINPFTVASVDLPATAEVTSIETPQLKAIHIVSDTDISVTIIYHKQYSTDSYLALPVPALGTQYAAVCYQTTATSFEDPRASEFGIVATQNNTNVTITPSSTTLNKHQVGTPFTVTLNQGETYLVYGDPNDLNSDLTGSAVSATQPIAFLSGHDRTELIHNQGQSRNCLVEQIPPNSTLGTSFITVPYAGRPFPVNDIFRVVAIVNNTQILQNGTIIKTINADGFYEFGNTEPQLLQTNNPVVLAQYSQSMTDEKGNYNLSPQFVWDPTMMVVPPTQQFISDYVFENTVDPTSFSDAYVNVVILTAETGTLVLDGAQVKNLFTPIGGTTYSYAQISVKQGAHHISAAEPFGIYVYGAGWADGYANAGGVGLRPLNSTLVAQSVDFGRVKVDSCKDSTFVIKDTGAVAITVTNLAVSGNDSNDFTIIGGAPPFTVAPKDSHIVILKFCPSTYDTLEIDSMVVTTFGVATPMASVQGTGFITGLTAKNYDFGKIWIDSCKDSAIIFRDTGDVPIDVYNLELTGIEPAGVPVTGDFSIVSGAPPFMIAPGDSHAVVFKFCPSVIDSEEMVQLVISTDAANPPIVTLKGTGLVYGLVGKNLNFGTYWIDSCRDSTIFISDTGNGAITVSSLVFSGGHSGDFSIISGGPPFTIAPGDSHAVVVRCCLTTIGTPESTQVILTSNAVAQPNIVLQATGIIMGRVTVQLPNLTVIPGSVISLPLTINNSDYLPFNNARHFTTTIHFDVTSLYPRDTNVGVIRGDVRYITFSDTLLDTMGILIAPEYLTMFADADTIPLVIDSFTTDGNNVQVTTINGQIILTGFCPADPPGQIVETESTTLSQNNPNPFAMQTTINYTISESEPAELFVEDALGRRVATLAKGDMPAGKYSAVLDAAELSSGLYFYVLQTPNIVLRRMFVVEK